MTLTIPKWIHWTDGVCNVIGQYYSEHSCILSIYDFYREFISPIISGVLVDVMHGFPDSTLVSIQHAPFMLGWDLDITISCWTAWHTRFTFCNMHTCAGFWRSTYCWGKTLNLKPNMAYRPTACNWRICIFFVHISPFWCTPLWRIVIFLSSLHGPVVAYPWLQQCVTV